MKKLLFALFCTAVIFTGCQKDPGYNVKVTGADLASINGMLKGTWVFPTQTLSVQDTSGKVLTPGAGDAAPALQFDGTTKVNIMPDIKTVLNGTYSLSTLNGFIFLEINYPDKTNRQYQLLLVNNQMLKLTYSLPDVYYDSSDNAIVAYSVFNSEYKRQSSADVTGGLVKVLVQSDSLFNVKVYAGHPDASFTLLDSALNVTRLYTFSYVAKHNDHVIVDIVGSLPKTYFYAYYNGLPLSGEVNREPTTNEITTGRGWIIP
ncbi:MAG: hypothetical protein ABI166_07760 [Mucilaginibacter sp.]